MRSTARRRTDALRGFRDISAESALMAPRVSGLRYGLWSSSSMGRPAGVVEAVPAEKASFTMRSSRTDRTRPRAARPHAATQGRAGRPPRERQAPR